MTLAFGPCMLFAPVVVVLFLLSIPLWGALLALLAIAIAVTWPIEQLCARLGLSAFRGASATLGRWLRGLSRPWRWLDLPAKTGAEPTSTVHRPPSI